MSFIEGHPFLSPKVRRALITLALFAVGCAPAAQPSQQINSPPAPSTPTVSPSPVVARSTPSPVSVAAATPQSAPPPRAQVAAAEPKRGGVLIVAQPGTPPSLDPAQHTGLTVTGTAGAYNRLVRYDPDTGTRVVGDLAESWHISADGKIYTFKLARDVTFHDGSRLTAQNVAFSLDRMISPPKGVLSNISFLLKPVTDKVEAVGEDTVRLVLTEPFPATLSTLALHFSPIYSEAYVKKNGDMTKTIMGTGPFQEVSYTPSVSLVMKRFSNYFRKGRPHLDGYTVLFIEDPSTRLAGLRTGKIDINDRLVGAVTAGDRDVLRASVPNMQFYSTVTATGPWFFMNTRSRPFSDVRVRRAVQLTIDRQAALKILAQNEGEVGNIFPLLGWGIARDDLLKLPGWRMPKDADRAEAKKLLAEAGYPNGLSFPLLSRQNKLTRETATFVAGDLKAIGIEAQVQVLPDPDFWAKGREHQHVAMVYTPAPLIPDPVIMARFSAPGAPLNFTGNESDSRLLALWSGIGSEVDDSKRHKVVEELERYELTERHDFAPIVWPSNFVPVQPYVRGYVRGISDYTMASLEDIWMDR